MYEGSGPGYVILDRRPESVVPAIGASKPGIAIVLDEDKLVTHVKALAKTTIFRRSDDDHAHEKFDARVFVRELHERVPDVNVRLYLGNEPGTVSLSRLAQWTLDALDECRRLGRKGVALNFATGEPEPQSWQGVLLPVLQFLKANNMELGLHEYASGPFLHPNQWHVGRWALIPKTLRPQIFITEVGYAKDLDPHAGWQGRIPMDTARAQLQSFHAHYLQYDIPSAVFILGDWHGFDVLPFSQQLQPPRPVTIVPALGGSKVRSGPGLYYSTVTVLTGAQGGLVTAPNAIPGSDPADTFKWWPVIAGANRGWMREDVVSFSTAPSIVKRVESNVPFYSQSSSTATLPNDCGIASARMLLGWQYQLKLGMDLTPITVDDVSHDVGLTGSQLTTTQHVLDATQKYGLKTTSVTWDLPSLKAELALRRPVILLVNASLLGTSGNYGGPHWVVAAGVADDDTIKILDPLGGTHWVPEEKVLLAWQGASAQGNPSRRAVVVVA